MRSVYGKWQGHGAFFVLKNYFGGVIGGISSIFEDQCPGHYSYRDTPVHIFYVNIFLI